MRLRVAYTGWPDDWDNLESSIGLGSGNWTEPMRNGRYLRYFCDPLQAPRLLFGATAAQTSLQVAVSSPATSFRVSAQSLHLCRFCKGCLPSLPGHSAEYDGTGQPRSGILSEQTSLARSPYPGRQSIVVWGRLANPRRLTEPSKPAVCGSHPSVQTVAPSLGPQLCSPVSCIPPKPQDSTLL